MANKQNNIIPFPSKSKTSTDHPSASKAIEETELFYSALDEWVAWLHVLSELELTQVSNALADELLRRHT